MKHLSNFIKCANKKFKWGYFILLLSLLFWGNGTAVATNDWVSESDRLEITNFVAGSLRTEIEDALISHPEIGGSLLNIKSLSIASSSVETLSPADATYLQTEADDLKKGLNTLVLNGISIISDNAFKGFKVLSSVTLSGVAKSPGIVIGNSAFYDTGLNGTINLTNVISLGTSAFEGTNFSSCTNSINLETIGADAFRGCTNLRPNSTNPNNSLANVKTIGDFAFGGCTSLQSVNLGSLTSLGAGAFQDCFSLEYVYFPGDDAPIPPSELGENAFLNNALNLAAPEIPEWVKTISTSAGNNVFLSQQPKVNIVLAPVSIHVLLNAEFGLFKPEESIKTLEGDMDYVKEIIGLPQNSYWLATGLNKPDVKICNSIGVEMTETDFKDLLKTETITPYQLMYRIFQNGEIIGQNYFPLTVSKFVKCIADSKKLTTDTLIITFPEANDVFDEIITISEGSSPSGSATPGTPVKIGDGTVWKVPVTDVAEGKVLVSISSSNDALGGGTEEVFLSKGPTLKFDLQGGNMPATGKEPEAEKFVVVDGTITGKLVTYNELSPKAVGWLPTPTRAGYKHLGWFTNPDGATPPGKIYTPIVQYQEDGDLTVYAHWELRTDYKIKLDPNGGTVDPDSIVGITFGAEIGQDPWPEPAWPGYNFIEWNTQDDGEGDHYDHETVYMEDRDTLTLYAQWELRMDYKIKLDPNGGSVDPDSIVGITFGAMIGKEPWPTPTRTGYEPTGWKDGNGIPYNHETEYTEADQDTLTLYAQWKAIENCKIKLDPNDGISEPYILSGSFIYDEPIGDVLPALTRTGYEPTGWNTSQDGSGDPYDAETNYTAVTPGTLLVLYAQWEPNKYEIILDPNGGLINGSSSYIIQDVPYDTEISGIYNLESPEPKPILFGHRLTGWNTLQDGSGKSYTNNSTYDIDDEIEGTLTLYAQWIPITGYELILDPNGGTRNGSSEPETIDDITYGAPIGKFLTDPEPIRTGHNFTVWKDIIGNVYDEDADYIIYTDDDELTLYAQWELKTDCKIKLDPDGGLVNGDSEPYLLEGSFTYNDPIGDVLLEPTRTGYNFTGWKDVNGIPYDKTTEYQATDPDVLLTLYAQWEARVDCKIKLDPNDEISDPYTLSESFTYDEPIGDVLPTLTRTGYEPAGWNTSPDGSGDSYDAETNYTAAEPGTLLILYAQWDANSYIINFDPTGGVLDKDDSTKTVKYNEPVGTFPWPERTGYVFLEVWTDDSGETYTEETIYEADGDITLYAQWRGEEYKLKFNANDGSTANLFEKPVVYGSPVGELLSFDQLPSRENYYSIDKWNTKPDGTGTDYDEEIIHLVQGDVTLYAQWIGVEYTIKFDKNDGTANNNPLPITVRYDALVGKLPSPSSYLGYKFDGWNTLPDGSGEPFDDNTRYLISGDTTLFAQWKANGYEITFNPNEGTVTPTSKPVTYDDLFGTLPIPVRNGYAFEGWWTSLDGSGELCTGEKVYKWATDTTLYAEWRKHSDNVDIDDIDVGGGDKTEYGDKNDLCFLMECGENTATVIINTKDERAKIVYGGKEMTGNSFDITFEKYGVIPITVTIKAEAGNTKDTTFYVARRFPFEQVVITRWDNTMTIINNPLNNGGFHFRTYQWYELPNITQPISDQQFYSAGQNGRSLPNREYQVALTADEYEGVLYTCVGKPVLKTQKSMLIYPNPVQINMELTVVIDEELTEADIEIYNLSGALLKREKAVGGVNTLNLPYPAGIYLVRVDGQTTTVIVE